MNRVLTTISYPTLTGILLFLFAACESKSGMNGDAFESLQQDKMMTGDSATVIAPDLIIEEAITAPKKNKKEILDEWAQFKIDMEKILTMNEKTIVEIKSIAHISTDLFDKVTVLENSNHSMSLDLYDYVEVDPQKHEKFKLKFKQELTEINNDLESLKLKTNQDVLKLI